jgi:D-beta-D-heptose 7-phosphate kinase/D-beta-D-heptose 1-phosphate adenosyltransferase
LAAVERHLPRVRGVICSDYKKGFLTPALLHGVIRAARRAGVPVLVDPKGLDYRCYTGASVLTPNAHELHLATALPVDSPEALEAAALHLLARAEAAAVLVTCGKDGMVLFERGQPPVRIPAEAREVYDVTGAGDTVIATLALAHCGGAPLAEAARLANTAAGVVVGKLGTATVSREELQHACDATAGTGEGKRLPLPTLLGELERLRAHGRRIVLTNGCFDLLHAGHVQYLQEARGLGEVLVVGLNTDRSVRALKGPKRPLVPETERAQVLAALACVDYVVLFDEPTPARLVAAVRPDVLVKGADYTGKEVVGRDVVEAAGGKVALLPLLEGQSTTGLVQTILERYREQS